MAALLQMSRIGRGMLVISICFHLSNICSVPKDADIWHADVALSFAITVAQNGRRASALTTRERSEMQNDGVRWN